MAPAMMLILPLLVWAQVHVDREARKQKET
jgi:hypothetical protein